MTEISNIQMLRALRNAKQDEIIGQLEGFMHMFFDEREHPKHDKLITAFIEEWQQL